MIKIRALRPTELKQVLILLNRYSDQESEYSLLQRMQQMYIPMHRLSQLLPLNLQFMPAIFVAVSRDKVLGLIWLSKDGRHHRRWRIDHLILDPDSFSYDVGTQLINYVINRYGGDGVQTFLAYVDQYYNTGLGLLKSCGFRRCGRLHYFSHQNPTTIQLEPISLSGLRVAINTDCADLKGLYNDSLPVEARVCLEKTSRDFYRPIGRSVLDKIKGVFFKRWVVEDAVREHLVGFADITTADYKDFYLSVSVSPGWEDSYPDLLTYVIQQVLLITGNARLHIDCYEFNKKGLETLEKLGFHRNSIAEVLVKDYWIPIEDKGARLTSPILLFSGKTTPATN